MSELRFKIKFSNPVEWVPNTLIVNVGQTDLDNGICYTNFELFNDEPLNTAKYVSRNWKDSGVVSIPLNVVAGIKNPDGSLDTTAINNVLAVFGLEIDNS